HKKSRVRQALDAVCSVKGKGFEAIAKEAIAYLANNKRVRKVSRSTKSAGLKRAALKKGNGTYIVAVDFTEFPALHERLTGMALEEMRDPDQQLLWLFRNTLRDMEAKLSN